MCIDIIYILVHGERKKRKNRNTLRRKNKLSEILEACFFSSLARSLAHIKFNLFHF